MTWKHGASGYDNYGCRCDECKAGHAAQTRDYRQRRKARRRERIVNGRFIPAQHRQPPRLAEVARDPWTREQESRACRRCGAAPGRQCVTASGSAAPLPHVERFRDAQDAKRLVDAR